MKRGTSEHPKVRRFARALGVGLAQAVGHLELMWHFTAKFAPAGDLGRFHDADIEEACAWEGGSGKMVAALTDSGWLDASAQHRVIVHDWSEHADDATNLTLARAGRLFADGKRPKTTRLLQAERMAVEAKLTEAESVRMASARQAHGKRRNAHGRASPSPPIPSHPIPSKEEDPPADAGAPAPPRPVLVLEPEPPRRRRGRQRAPGTPAPTDLDEPQLAALWSRLWRTAPWLLVPRMEAESPHCGPRQVRQAVRRCLAHFAGRSESRPDWPATCAAWVLKDDAEAWARMRESPPSALQFHAHEQAPEFVPEAVAVECAAKARGAA